MSSKIRKKQSNKKVGKKHAKKKYPLRGKPVVYREPFKAVDWDVSENSPRVPGVDEDKVIIRPNFDDPLEEFDK